MTDLSASRKSADAFRTISEVADDLGLPQHVLRFWETRFPEIKPLKRAGGRRFYRPDDVTLLRAIQTLLYGDGYTIKGVQRLLQEQGLRAVALAAAVPVGVPQQESRAAGWRDEPEREAPPPLAPAVLPAADRAAPAAPLPAAPMRPAARTGADARGPGPPAAGRPDLLARLERVLVALDEAERLLAAVRRAPG